MGTGGLIIDERVNIDEFEPIKTGGTGSNSGSEEQPKFLPDMAESGTPNTVGLAGLVVAIQCILEKGIEAIRAHEIALAQELIDGLREIPKVTVYGGLDARLQTSTVSFNIEGMEPSDVGCRLDEEHGVMCRVGLHCTPASHKTIGTFPDGTVRFGLGFFNTSEEVKKALYAVQQLTNGEK